MNQPVNSPEPWLRGTLAEIPAIQRAVLHAFQAAEEDLQKWCAGLTDNQIHLRPAGLASIAFHLRHIPGAVDRLLTYVEGNELSQEQLHFLKSESAPEITLQQALQDFTAAMNAASERVRKLQPSMFEEIRYVGRKRMPTTVGGLLVHVADHTQRHVGQAITTAKLIHAQREPANTA